MSIRSTRLAASSASGAQAIRSYQGSVQGDVITHAALSTAAVRTATACWSVSATTGVKVSTWVWRGSRLGFSGFSARISDREPRCTEKSSETPSHGRTRDSIQAMTTSSTQPTFVTIERARSSPVSACSTNTTGSPQEPCEMYPVFRDAANSACGTSP